MKTTTKVTKAAPVPSRVRVVLSPGQAVRIARELQEITQADLAELCDIPQSTISAIESGRVKLGAERAERLARALRVHPAVLLWPNWSETEAPAVPSRAERARSAAPPSSGPRPMPRPRLARV